jgi:hypothetical protein
MVRSVLQGDEIFLVSFLFVVNQMHIAPEFAEPVLAEKELPGPFFRPWEFRFAGNKF